MEITEVLNPRTIITHLNVNSKDEAFDAIIDRFVAVGAVTDKEAFKADVYERETFGPTGIGNYVAIPHGKSEAVADPGVAIAVLDHEIEWESLDDTGAKVVILFAVGADNEAAMEHLKMLAMFSKSLGDDAVVARLIGADTASDVINAFSEDGEDVEDDAEDEELDLDAIAIM